MDERKNSYKTRMNSILNKEIQCIKQTEKKKRKIFKDQERAAVEEEYICTERVVGCL